MAGMNPRKMQQMMKQLGIQQTDIPAKLVIIKTEDSEIIIHNPSVAKVNIMGQETFQISGDIEEKELSSAPDISPDDIKAVMDQTGVDEQTAKDAIEEAQGDLAQAILDIQSREE